MLNATTLFFNYFVVLYSRMMDIVFKIWFLIVILPILIAQEAWAMIKAKKAKGENWYQPTEDDWPFFLLAILVFLLIFLILISYA